MDPDLRSLCLSNTLNIAERDLKTEEILQSHKHYMFQTYGIKRLPV